MRENNPYQPSGGENYGDAIFAKHRGRNNSLVDIRVAENSRLYSASFYLLQCTRSFDQMSEVAQCVIDCLAALRMSLKETPLLIKSMQDVSALTMFCTIVSYTTTMIGQIYQMPDESVRQYFENNTITLEMLGEVHDFLRASLENIKLKKHKSQGRAAISFAFVDCLRSCVIVSEEADELFKVEAYCLSALEHIPKVTKNSIYYLPNKVYFEVMLANVYLSYGCLSYCERVCNSARDSLHGSSYTVELIIPVVLVLKVLCRDLGINYSDRDDFSKAIEFFERAKGFHELLASFNSPDINIQEALEFKENLENDLSEVKEKFESQIHETILIFCQEDMVDKVVYSKKQSAISIKCVDTDFFQSLKNNFLKKGVTLTNPNDINEKYKTTCFIRLDLNISVQIVQDVFRLALSELYQQQARTIRIAQAKELRARQQESSKKMVAHREERQPQPQEVINRTPSIEERSLVVQPEPRKRKPKRRDLSGKKEKSQEEFGFGKRVALFPLPSCFQWPNGFQYPSGNVYMLTNNHMPDNIWFGYIPEAAMIGLDEDTQKLFDQKLSGGRIAYQCVRDIRKEVQDRSRSQDRDQILDIYRFKIVIKGGQGRGDLRLYGWVEDILEESGNKHFLICFGLLADHKLRVLPDPVTVKKQLCRVENDLADEKHSSTQCSPTVG